MKRVLLVCTLLLLAACAPPPTPAPPPTATVDPGPTPTPYPTLSRQTAVPTPSLTPTATPVPLLQPLSLGQNRDRIPNLPEDFVISADGQRAAYLTDARGVVQGVAGDIPRAYLYDTERGSTILMSPPVEAFTAGEGWTTALDMTPDGNTLAFITFFPTYDGCLPGAEWCGIVVVIDIDTEQADVFTPGIDWPLGLDLALSEDGDTIVVAAPGGYTDEGLLVYNRDEQTPTAIIAGDTTSGIVGADTPVQAVAVSADGCVIAYASALNTETDVNESFDVYRYDCETEESTLLSTPNEGEHGFGDSGVTEVGTTSSDVAGDIAISADGSVVAFSSYAPTLAGGDVPICPNGPCGQVYVYDAEGGQLSLISAGPNGEPADGDSFGEVMLSPNGRYVGFTSQAGNLDPTYDCPPPEEEGQPCTSTAYVHDLRSGETVAVSVDMDVPYSPPVSRILAITDTHVTFWTGGFYGTNGVIFQLALDDLP